MSTLLPFLVGGVVTGSLYGLAGVGLVLTYRTSGVLNLSHGTIAAAAAYAFYSLHVDHGVPWPVAGLVTVTIFGLVVGFVMEQIAARLADVPETLTVVATVGIALGTEGLLYLVYGSTVRSFPTFLPASGFSLAGVNISWSQAIAFGIASAAAGGLYLFMQRSRLGIAMRAVVDDPTLVTLTGEPSAWVRRRAWTIGCTFAAVSGILLAPTLGLDANLLTLLVVQALGACAIGLFSSLPLTFAGGIFVGVAASLAAKYCVREPFSGIPSAVPFLVLLAALLIVPAARFPRRQLVARRSDKARAGGASVNVRRAAAAIGLVALLSVPQLVGARLPVWSAALCFALVFASMGLLVWHAGQISLCHAAFVAVGAASMGHATAWGLPWPAALVVAGLLTVPVGAIVAIPALRVSGIYLALATLGFGILMQNVLFRTWLVFGNPLVVTMGRPRFGPFDGTDDRQMYFLLLAVVVVSVLVLRSLSRSRLGLMLRAMSESPTMLVTSGLEVNISRVIVFCTSAFFAGIAGGLLVTEIGAVGSIGYGALTSLVLLAVLTVSGRDVVPCAVIGALAYQVLPAYASSFGSNQQLLAFGLVSLLAVVGSAAGIRGDLLARWIGPADRSASRHRRRAPRPDRPALPAEPRPSWRPGAAEGATR